jgi:hypothetical protein
VYAGVRGGVQLKIKRACVLAQHSSRNPRKKRNGRWDGHDPSNTVKVRPSMVLDGIREPPSTLTIMPH